MSGDKKKITMGEVIAIAPEIYANFQAEGQPQINKWKPTKKDLTNSNLEVKPFDMNELTGKGTEAVPHQVNARDDVSPYSAIVRLWWTLRSNAPKYIEVNDCLIGIVYMGVCSEDRTFTRLRP